jgi:nucleoside phosphorylase
MNVGNTERMVTETNVRTLGRAIRCLAVISLCLAGRARAQSVLILGAVPQEIVPIQEALQNHQRTVVGGIPCDTGTLGGHEVVVALTGVGKTNSAMVTTAMLTHFHPKVALMTGTAARIRSSVRTGDIIIATTTSFHDAGSLTSSGMVQGKLDANGRLTTTEWFSPTREKSNPFVFPDSPELVEFAEKLAADYKPQDVSLDGATYTPVIRKGTVTSGDLSGVTEAKIADIRAKLDPDLMEMESAAFAQVCQFYQVPHLVIRSGSNQAEERNNDDYLRLSPIAAKQAAMFTLEIAGKLPLP